MQYTHKRKNGLCKFLYLTLICLGFISTFIKASGIWSSVLSVLGIAFILGGMLIFMKFDATVYSVVVNARETDFDFFISKAIGKRGAYVCYFYISDAIKIVKYDGLDTKEALKQEFNGIRVHSYVHSMLSKDRYAIIFKLENNYDALVVELNNEALAQLEHFMSVAQAVSERHKEAHGYGDDDDDDEITDAPVVSDAEKADTVSEITIDDTSTEQ